MKVKVIFHGDLRRHNNGKSDTETDLKEGTTVGQLIARTQIPTDKIAFAGINGSRVDKTVVLNDGDEVTIFQMVAGG